MTVSSNTLANLSTLLAEEGPKYFQTAMSNAAPLLKSGLLPKEDTEGDEYVVTIYPSDNHATAFVLDGGTTPTGGSDLPAKCRALPSVIFSQITMGRAAAKAKLSDGARTRQLDALLKTRSQSIGRQFNAALHGGSIAPQAVATWSGTAAGSTVDIDVLDVRLFRPGMAIDFHDASASKSYTVRVTAVTPKAVGSNTINVAGTISLINDVPDPSTGSAVALTDTSVTTSDLLALRGTYVGFGGSGTAQGAVVSSFDDMAGSGAGATFMGFDPTSGTNGIYGWTGNYQSLGAAYAQDAALAFHSRVASVSDVAPNVAVCHPQTAAAHAASGAFAGGAFGNSLAASAATPRQLDRSVDKFGNVYEDSGLRLAGAKVVQDQNCQIGRIEMFNNELTKLAVWAEIGPDQEGNEAMLLGRGTYTIDMQFSGLSQLVTDKRSSVGVFDGISGF